MFRLQFLVYVDVKLSTLSDLTRKIYLQIGFFSSNDNLSLMIWDDMIILKLIIPRIWGLNRLKNMILDINRYLHKALSPRNHFQTRDGLYFRLDLYFIVAVSQIFLVLILNSKLRGLPEECVCALWLAVQQNTVLV